jgi:Ca-activated chloride channel family protein
LNFNQVNVRIKDQLATTTIEQEFYNPNSRQLEGTFLFPVPKGAQINKFTIDINGKPVDAELMVADKARGIFEEIVRKLKDPALLEYAGRDVYKVRIFPIEANSKKRVTVGYSQMLRADNGLINYTLPLTTEKSSGKPLKTLSVKVDLETKRPLKSIYSPSHKVEVRRQGDNKASLGYEGNNVSPEADFQLFYSHEESDLGVNLMTFKPDGEDGYFVLLASPGAETKKTRANPKDVAFVLDTSGSMAGHKLEQAKKALLFCVDNLNDEDRFEVIRFSTEVEPLFEKLVEATDKNRSRARDFIKDLKPIGGTAIDDALRKALATRPAKLDRPFVVIFLTDGRPTIGLTDENQIVDSVIKSNQANTRIFCFGIGTDVNTHLLDKITEETKAFSQYVLPEEDIEVKVSNFYTKIKEPVLANPRITFPDGAHVTRLYPSPVPDLFKGEQLILVGRYRTPADGAVEIDGSINGENKKFAYDVKFSGDRSEHDFIPRLWATRRVGYLLDEIRLRGESKELKDEVSDLARKYNIVTPYTAYLIIEDETRRQVPTAMQSFRFENNVTARNELQADYYSLVREKDGDRGVAGARSARDLKAAQSAGEAITLGREEGLRGRMASAPLTTSPDTSSLNLPAIRDSAGISGRYAYATPGQTEIRKKSSELAEQSRFIQGRTFYQNGSQWIDALAQTASEATHTRIRFNSPEYFDLLKQHPEASAWLSLGRNLQFLLGHTVYEIYDAE